MAVGTLLKEKVQLSYYGPNRHQLSKMMQALEVQGHSFFTWKMTPEIRRCFTKAYSSSYS
jgi:hypothetical protein